MTNISNPSVELFSDVQFGGKSTKFHFLEGYNYYEEPNSEGHWMKKVGNDAISSMKVGKGLKLELFNDSGFRGSQLTLFEGEYPRLLDWNDKITGFKLYKIAPEYNPVVTFFYSNNYTDSSAARQGLSVGEYPNSSFFLKNDSLKVISIPAGVEVQVFTDSNYGGASQTFSNSGIFTLSQYALDDKISSIKITSKEYGLVSITFSPEGVITSNSIKETVASKVSTFNDSSSAKITSTISITKTYDATVTTSQSQTNSYGISVGVSAAFNIKGVVDVEKSITTSALKEYSSEKEESYTTGQELQSTLAIEILPKTSVVGNMFVTPVEKTYKVTYLYQRVDINKNPIPNGHTYQETGTVTLRYATDTEIRVVDTISRAQ